MAKHDPRIHIGQGQTEADLVRCPDCWEDLGPVPDRARWTDQTRGPAEIAAYRSLGALRYVLEPDVWSDVNRTMLAAFEELRRR